MTEFVTNWIWGRRKSQNNFQVGNWVYEYMLLRFTKIRWLGGTRADLSCVGRKNKWAQVNFIILRYLQTVELKKPRGDQKLTQKKVQAR